MRELVRAEIANSKVHGIKQNKIETEWENIVEVIEDCIASSIYKASIDALNLGKENLERLQALGYKVVYESPDYIISWADGDIPPLFQDEDLEDAFK